MIDTSYVGQVVQEIFGEAADKLARDLGRSRLAGPRAGFGRRGLYD